MTVRSTTLSSGLRVVTHEMPDLETVSAGVWAAAGSRLERAEEHGVAHFLEHMAFKGTESRSALDIAQEIEAAGGHLNAATAHETTAYYARVLKDDLPLALDVLSDILLRPAFEVREIERECSVILQEIGEALDTPDDLVFDDLMETAFEGQAMGRTILGTAQSVAAVDAGRLSSFLTEHYRAGSMVVAAAGAVDHDRFTRLVEDRFAGLPEGVARQDAAARFGTGTKRRVKDLEQAHLVFAMPAVSYGDDDYFAMQVLSALIGGGMSSRLFQEVREKRGLCYSVYSFFWPFSDHGIFGIYAGTGETELPALTDTLARELGRLPGGITEEEAARARAQLKAGLLMSLESSPARAEQIARQTLVFGRVLDTAELIDRVDAVDRAALDRLATRLAEPEALSLAAAGPVGALATDDRIAEKFRVVAPARPGVAVPSL